MDIKNKIITFVEHKYNTLYNIIAMFLSISFSYIITFSFIVGGDRNTRNFGFFMFVIFLFILFFLSKILIKINTSFVIKSITAHKEELSYFNKFNILSFTPFIIFGVIVIFQFITTLYFYNSALAGSIESFDKYTLLIEKINSTVVFLFFIIFFLISSLITQYIILTKLEKIKQKDAIFSNFLSLIIMGMYGFVVYLFFYVSKLIYAIIGFVGGGGMFGP